MVCNSSSCSMKNKGEGCSKTINYPQLWYHMHTFAITSTSNSNFKQYMKDIARALPGKCGEGLRGYLKEHKITERTEPFRYTWKLHNAVNKRIGKTELSYRDAKKLYT